MQKFITEHDMKNINLLLADVRAVAKTTERQYSPVRFEEASLVSSLLCGTRAMLVLNMPAFEENTQIITVSMETVCIAKSRPRENLSEL